MADKKIILGFIILQIAICFPVLNQFPIALDEPFSIFHSQQPLHTFWKIFEDGNNAPLHFILLHGWIKLFGISAIAVRSLSLVINLVSIIFLYKLGRKFWSQSYTGLLIGLFIFSRLDHFVAMEARMYGLFTLFFILILYDSYQLLFEEKRVYLLLGTWNALLLYSHYLGGAILLMELLIFVFYYRLWTPKKLKYVLISILISLLLYLPNIALLLSRSNDFKKNGTWVDVPEWTDLWTVLVKLMNNQVTFFMTVLLLVGLYLLRERKEHSPLGKEVSYFTVWFIGTYMMFYLISVFVQPIFIIKYVQFLTIPLFLILVGLAERYKPSPKLRFIPFLMCIPFALSFKYIPDVNREPDQLVAYVLSLKKDNTTVYYCPSHYNNTLAYHYDLILFQNYDNMINLMEKDGFVAIQSGEDVNVNLTEFIYIDFESELLYPNNNILSTMNEGFVFEELREFKGGFTVNYFKKR